jgi:hypothetical protein
MATCTGTNFGLYFGLFFIVPFSPVEEERKGLSTSPFGRLIKGLESG